VRAVRLQRDPGLVCVQEHPRSVQRFANADVRAVTCHELLSGSKALVMQKLQPRARPVDAVSLIEQLDAGRADAARIALAC
jgi:hypothetical protein